jgi:hypothetical protein
MMKDKAEQRLHNQNVLSGYGESGAKYKVRPCNQTLVMDMIPLSCSSIFTRLVTRKYLEFNTRKTLKPNNERYGSKDTDDENSAMACASCDFSEGVW